MKALVPPEWRDIAPPERKQDTDYPPVPAERERTAAADVAVLRLRRYVELWEKRRRPQGITIVELLVVMAIVSGIMGISVYAMGMVGSADLREDANRVASAIKYSYSVAAINNTQYRLVLDLDTGEYYTEVAQEPIVEQSAPTEATDDFLTEEAQRLAERVEEKRDLFDDADANPFGMNRKITYQRVQDGVLKNTHLQDGVRFERVLTMHRPEEAYEDGQVSITFFPNGFQEQAMIVMKDERGAAFTLLTEPLTGRVRTYSDEIDVPSNFGLVEEDD